MTKHIEEEMVLLPCPFCASQQITTSPCETITDDDRPEVTWAAICKACAARVDRDTEAEAIAAWNTRNPNVPTPTEQPVEMGEKRIAAEELAARKLLARRERDLGFTGYADWLDAGCPQSPDHEYPHEKIADICFYISAYDPNGMREALAKARAVLTNSQAESGYCMCGDPVASHSIGSGHSPVDSHIYMADQVIEEIDAVLSHKKDGGDHVSTIAQEPWSYMMPEGVEAWVEITCRDADYD